MTRSLQTIATGVIAGFVFGSFAFYHSEFDGIPLQLLSDFEEPWRDYFEGRRNGWWLLGVIVWVLLLVLLRRLEPLRARSWRAWVSVVIASSCLLAVFDFIPLHERRFTSAIEVLVPGATGLVWALLPKRAGILWRGYILVVFLGLLSRAAMGGPGFDFEELLLSTLGLSAFLAPTMWLLVHFEPRLRPLPWAVACTAGVIVVGVTFRYVFSLVQERYSTGYTDQTVWTCALAPLAGVWLAKPTLVAARRELTD